MHGAFDSTGNPVWLVYRELAAVGRAKGLSAERRRGRRGAGQGWISPWRPTRCSRRRSRSSAPRQTTLRPWTMPMRCGESAAGRAGWTALESLLVFHV